MKYIILVPDGVADEPVGSLDGKTPLEVARIPHMNLMAQQGFSGLVQTIPEGMHPGSDVGNLSLLGYNPLGSLSGRAPLEAANLGINVKDDEIAFRCNLVTVIDEKMIDYSAGHISIEEASSIMEDIAFKLDSEQIKYYTGKSYRHIAIIRSDAVAALKEIACMPPHDILNQPIAGHLPQGALADILLDQMQRSKEVLSQHPVNLTRVRAGKLPATMTWFWGQGQRPRLESYQVKFGLKGSVISAVDLVNGIGRIVGLNIISVPGVTGYLDTNFKGKAQYALESLKDHDFVFVHVEATDETGHNGDVEGKIKAVEHFDADVVGPVLAWVREHPDTRVLVSPDHPTPLNKRTHTSAAVPFVMYGKNIEPNGFGGYNESFASKAGLKFGSGEQMIEYFIGKRKV
ncbi:MAG: cofactor-independent phosphoglycerate mutase [Candidatus Omnitrophota bacterium]